MLQEDNTYLKRGKGKISGDVKKKHFFSFYKKHAKETKIPFPLYNAFLKDLITTYSTKIVTEGLELKLLGIGRIRVQSNPLKFFRKDGTKAKLRVNWQETWKYWHTIYPTLTKDEIVKLEKKIIIYHENEHSQQEFYCHLWDKITVILRHRMFYTFKAARQYSRLIAKVVKDPNRKTFYYG